MFPPPNAIADLPIVHTLYQAYLIWHDYLKKFPKAHKYSLGQRISEKLLDVLEYVLAAAAISGHAQKAAYLTKASQKLDVLKLLIRACKDCDCITQPQYFHISRHMHEGGNMLGAWLRSERSKIGKQ